MKQNWHDIDARLNGDMTSASHDGAVIGGRKAWRKPNMKLMSVERTATNATTGIDGIGSSSAS